MHVVARPTTFVAVILKHWVMAMLYFSEKKSISHLKELKKSCVPGQVTT
jgi:hypothetical protein